jgi:two-component sensor histidine kinase
VKLHVHWRSVVTGSSDRGDNEPTPVVEPKPGETAPPATSRALDKRIRQQELLAEIGVMALQGSGFERLLAETVRLTADGMEAEFCKILEHIPDENRFLVRAGVGWEPGIVGKATVGADLESPAGFALQTGQPVISNHLENEQRFRTPELLVRHGIHRAINVILQGDGKPFGVLEVDSRSEDEFTAHDLTFLQGAANVLGMAIERERQDRSLKAALAHQEVLLKEITHRVKNSLAIVASMLQLQASHAGDPELTQQLEEAAHRVSAVARAHERIHPRNEPDKVDLGLYIEEVCRDLNEIGHRTIHVEAQRDVPIATDRAIPIALIVNELITNATKYAYEGRDGRIFVRLALPADDVIEIGVRDEGVGLPPGFQLRAARSLGMRIVLAFVQQLNAKLTFDRLDPGTEFVLLVPR